MNAKIKNYTSVKMYKNFQTLLLSLKKLLILQSRKRKHINYYL